MREAGQRLGYIGRFTSPLHASLRSNWEETPEKAPRGVTDDHFEVTDDQHRVTDARHRVTDVHTVFTIAHPGVTEQGV